MLREWHPHIKNAGSLLIQLASDENPRVRAQAVVAAAYYQGPDAAEVVFAAERLPQDLQLTADLKEARNILNVDQYIREAIANNKKLSQPAQLYMLKNASVNELVKLEPSEAVYLAILSRQNVPAQHLRYALGGLAKLQKTSDLGLFSQTHPRFGCKRARGESEWTWRAAARTIPERTGEYYRVTRKSSPLKERRTKPAS